MPNGVSWQEHWNVCEAQAGELGCTMGNYDIGIRKLWAPGQTQLVSRMWRIAGIPTEYYWTDVKAVLGKKTIAAGMCCRMMGLGCRVSVHYDELCELEN